jgi:putative transposase
VPKGLKRYQQTGDLHYVTFSCYRRLPYLGTPRSRDVFEEVLEITRRRHNLWINAYVVMPEHVHLLLSEPGTSLLAVALKALKRESARRLKDSENAHFWQARYYDFNVYSEKKRAEKVDYIHRNPVKRELAREPEEWLWSSARHYATGGEQHVVQITSRYTEQKAVRTSFE